MMMAWITKGMISPGKSLLHKLVLAVLLFVIVNLIAIPLAGVRFDMTEEKLFSLSDGTKKLVQTLTHPLEVKVYASHNLLTLSPPHARYHERIRVMLNDFARLSDGRLKVGYIDPLPFSEEEDQAVLDGIRALPLGNGGQTGYFGLALIRLQDGTKEATQVAINESFDFDDKNAIPFLALDRESFLEYDLARLISLVDQDRIPTIGILGEVDPLGFLANGRPWVSASQLEESFTLERVVDAATLFSDYAPDILWIVHPGELAPEMVYALDQYMLRGGRAMIFLDAFYESAVTRQFGPGQFVSRLPRQSSLPQPLLEKWGLTFSDENVVLDAYHATVIETSQDRNTSTPAPHYAWLTLHGLALSPESPITVNLSSLIFPSAGAFGIDKTTPLKIEQLAITSPDSGLVRAEKLEDSKIQINPTGLIEDFKSDGKPELLALRVSGKTKSAFAKGPSKAIEQAILRQATENQIALSALPKHIKASKDPMQAVLVGDVDMLQDRFWVQQQSFAGEGFVNAFSGNGAFLLNVAENLGGNDNLIGVRNKTVKRRPFFLIEQLRLEAERLFRAKEQALSQELTQIQNQLDALDGNSDDEETLKLVEEFTNRLVDTRQQLRAVQHNLNREIALLEAIIKIVIIGFVPALLALVTFVIFWRRYRRRISYNKAEDARRA